MTQPTKKVNWPAAITLILYQFLLVLILPFYFYFYTPSLTMVLATVVLFFLTGISITGGYHRLYAHRAYRVRPLVETVILFFGSMAGQGSALRWSFDHRLHHAHVDTDDDPYSIKKGFWYAHFLWLLDPSKPIDQKVVPDLMKNRFVMFQHKNIGLCMVLANVVVFISLGYFLNDFIGACILAVWTRLFALHHFTWFINSLAHTWGDKPFSQEQSAVNNYILCFLTFGEGYHNFHHTFSNDYRNGVRWYHFDPTKWTIWVLHKCGLAYDLKRINTYTIRRKMVIEHRKLLLEKVTTYWQAKKEDLEQRVNNLSEALTAKLAQITQLRDRYYQFKQANYGKEALNAIKKEIKQLKKSLHTDWKEWTLLSKDIINGKFESAPAIS